MPALFRGGGGFKAKSRSGVCAACAFPVWRGFDSGRLPLLERGARRRRFPTNPVSLLVGRSPRRSLLFDFPAEDIGKNGGGV